MLADPWPQQARYRVRGRARWKSNAGGTSVPVAEHPPPARRNTMTRYLVTRANLLIFGAVLNAPFFVIGSLMACAILVAMS